MKIEYQPTGTCSKMILADIDDETRVINNVQFIGGCPGNTLGVSALVKGQKVDDVIKKLEGIRCGMKSTSCPDQLARALRQALPNGYQHISIYRQNSYEKIYSLSFFLSIVSCLRFFLPRIEERTI